MSMRDFVFEEPTLTLLTESGQVYEQLLVTEALEANIISQNWGKYVRPQYVPLPEPCIAIYSTIAGTFARSETGHLYFWSIIDSLYDETTQKRTRPVHITALDGLKIMSIGGNNEYTYIHHTVTKQNKQTKQTIQLVDTITLSNGELLMLCWQQEKNDEEAALREMFQQMPLGN
jgi:hypothetical protein